MYSRLTVPRFQHSDLLFAWTVRTIRARYQQTLLGGLWAIIQPAGTVAIFTIVFTQFVPVDTLGIPYSIFAYTAMVPWILFSSSVTDMVDSIVSNINLVSKIYFPRVILVIAAMFARLLDFAIAFMLLLLLMLYYGIPLFSTNWLYLPALLSIQLTLALGIGLAGAALNVFYRDIRHVIVLILQLWMYASPIIYPVALVPEHWRPFYFLNPMAGAIEGYRSILLHNTIPGPYLYISASTALLALVVGYWFFKRVEHQFADLV
jgi:lipopolysaccharide transport system permease protein